MFSKKFLLSQIIFLAAAALLLVLYLRSQAPQLEVLGQVNDFHLINSEGKDVSLKDLKGKIWIADFFFTTCSNICPMMTGHMSHLQETFKPYSDVRLVSFSVNPENDSPEVLKKYADKFHADTNQWMFLTGSREEMTKVTVGSFKLGDIHEPIFHSSYFTLVDKQGRIRGYYDSNEPKNIDKAILDLKQLSNEDKWMNLPVLPTINASLNGLAGIFLVLGFFAIRRKNILLHRKLMISSFLSSTLFLCCYLYYHFTSRGISHYQGHGLSRIVYFTVLGTHTPLAVLIVPFIIMAIRHALRGEFAKHTKITRWLYPTWLYVSVTGVVIYLMLYIFPAV